MISNPNIKRVG